MGLLYSASNDNKQIVRGLTVSYSKSIINGYWSWTNNLNVILWSLVAYQYARYAECEYVYVGLDYNTACYIANTIRNNYTRDFWLSDFHSSGAYTGTFLTIYGGKKCQGTVDVEQHVGHLYNIRVIISETDYRMSMNLNESFGALFSAENLRQYDY